MSIYKTRQEVLRAAADWIDVCEAAGVVARCRANGDLRLISECFFSSDPSTYEFPLGLIDGKEVWEGDTVYCDRGLPLKADRTMNFNPPESVWSLTPPKPKTVGAWTPEGAVRIAHESGFAGTSWHMGAEELAYVLNVANSLQPKPKTVMVELLVEDAKAMCEFGGMRWYDNLAEACRKALEQPK